MNAIRNLFAVAVIAASLMLGMYAVNAVSAARDVAAARLATLNATLSVR